jgi:glutamine synthetase
MGGPGLVQIQYTDLVGFLRGVEVPYESLEKTRFPGALDGSSVYGFLEIERSDLLLEPVMETLKQVPWREGLWRVIGRIYTPEGLRFTRDPRFVAETLVGYLAELGFTAITGAELEFFLFESVKIKSSNPHTGLGYKLRSLEYPLYSSGYFNPVKRAYHTVEPMDTLASFRIEFSRALSALGYGSDVFHHEVAVSQMEASLRAGSPVYVGDEIVTAKWVARNIAKSHGLIAVFMPKPVFGDNGSGLHLHMSLWDTGMKSNLFVSDGVGLSEIARNFIAGILEHARSLSAIVAPTTNSYKRLVPGYEAPVYCVWGYYNRSAIIRIPATSDPRRFRVEFRAPDPTANPYLAITATIMAGLDGIKRRLDPGDPFEGNTYKLSRDDLRRLNIKTLPSSLDEALEELESDMEYLKPVFPKDLLEIYIELKRTESREVNMRPHPYEFYMYLSL